jgi:hypothetical protein
VLRLVLVAVCAATPTGCTVTVTGAAVKAPADRERAVGALMAPGVTRPQWGGRRRATRGNDPVEAASDDRPATTLVDIGAGRGFIAGLSSGGAGEDDISRLQNLVLRFPNPDSAAAAAGELAAVNPSNEAAAQCAARQSSGPTRATEHRPCPCRQRLHPAAAKAQ